MPAAELEALSAPPVAAQIGSLRDALAAADIALELAGELPAETTGPVVGAVRKRLATALAALENVEKAVGGSRTA